MNHNIILHISDRANSCNSALAALKEAGYEIVSTNSPSEGVALLYIMHSVAAVVLDNPARTRQLCCSAEPKDDSPKRRPDAAMLS
jgi:hypothetical protein